MTGSKKISIAVGDAVLAESLRFSLELEGYEPELCDAATLWHAARDAGCVLIDQSVLPHFDKPRQGFAELEIPVILMVGQKTRRTLDRARAVGVTRVVETPFHDGVLFDEIHRAVSGISHASREPAGP